MSRYFLCVLVILGISTFSSAQEGGGTLNGWLPYEIFVLTKGLPAGVTIRYQLEAQGSVWGTSDLWPPQGYFLTNEYDFAYYPLNGTVGNLPSGWTFADVHGFDFVNTGEDNDYYAYGLYRLTSTYGNAYCYLDYRDSRYRFYGPTIDQNYHHPQDFWIMFDGSIDKFYYHSKGSLDLDPTAGGWTAINNGDYLPIWQVKEQENFGSPQTNEFNFYWNNALSVVEQNGHPLLVWGGFSLSNNVDHYNVFRKVSASQGFVKVHETTNGTVSNYLDTDITIDSGPPNSNEISVYYYLTATYIPSAPPLIESNPSNVVEVDKNSG